MAMPMTMGKFSAFLTFMTIMSLGDAAVPSEDPVHSIGDNDISLEDFEAALAEGDPSDSDVALSLLQKRVIKVQGGQASTLPGVENHDKAGKDHHDEIKIDDFSEAFDTEDGAATTGLSLMQTSASMERSGTHSSDGVMTGTVSADGTIEISTPKAATTASSNGHMVFSVDSHGGLHNEASMEL